MPSLITSLALLAFASLSLAAPHEQMQPRNQKFSINQIAAGKRVKSGPRSMMDMYNKYHGGNAPAPVRRAAENAAAQQGSVVANEKYHENYWVCPVQIGDSTVNLQFDTGSADLWTYSLESPSSISNGHNLYDSSTGQNTGNTFQIHYGGDSEVRGIVYTDKVVVGGATATSQAVEVATSASSDFQGEEKDGILGLSFGDADKPPFFDSIQDRLESKLFTVDLRHNQPGSFDFGYIDDSKHTGSITYNDIYTTADNRYPSWAVVGGAFSAGSDEPSGNVGPGIVDTGTNMLYVPTDVAAAYWSKVPNSQNSAQWSAYVFPCDADLPDFNVVIGGAKYTVPGLYINMGPNGDGTCYGGIQQRDGWAIFGDVFIKSVLVVFDRNANTSRIGFAPKPVYQ